VEQVDWGPVARLTSSPYRPDRLSLSARAMQRRNNPDDRPLMLGATTRRANRVDNVFEPLTIFLDVINSARPVVSPSESGTLTAREWSSDRTSPTKS